MHANAATLLGWALPPARAERATKSWRCSACHRCFVEAVHAAEVLPSDRCFSRPAILTHRRHRFFCLHSHWTRAAPPRLQGVLREAELPLLQRRLPRCPPAQRLRAAV